MGFAGGDDGVARSGELQVGLANALGESVQLRAQRGNVLVNGLELKKARNRRMHLTQV
jgi:hypothetical protein